MTSLKQLMLAVSFLGILGPQAGLALEDAGSVRFGEPALTFAAGSIQKTTPHDGIVNLISGDNQTTGNRMLLGKRDIFYLNLNRATDVAIGDLFTVYRRVRKVFHPQTGEYLGFVTIRLAVVRVVDIDHTLATVEAIRAYGMVSPGDMVMRFADPTSMDHSLSVGSTSERAGMIVELQADKTMTMVSQSDVVYLDRGREDGLKPGDLLEVYRHSAGLPSRKIGKLKVLAIEDRTATAKITKASTLVIRGDRFKLTGSARADSPGPHELVASQLKMQDALGQTRINLGELKNLLHYDSGEAVIKADSYQVLDQLIEHIRTTGDGRLIRVEGHADNVEIGPSLKSRYANNWDLSKARASSVVRYLIEKGGLDSARLSSVGYGDSRPAAPNASEAGRTKNRRVEIVLHAPPTDSPAPTREPSDAPKVLGSDDLPDMNSKGLSPSLPAMPSAVSATTEEADSLAVLNLDGTAGLDPFGTLESPVPANSPAE